MTLINKLKSILIIPFLISLVSCASLQNDCGCSNSLNIDPPFKSFVKIKTLKGGAPWSTASGVIVDQVNGTNTIIMTAKHVCEDEDGKKSFIIQDFDSKEYDALIISTEDDHDLCILTTKVKIDAKSVRLSEVGPFGGNNAFNLAAPYGIYDYNMTLIFHGHYSGKIHIMDEKFPMDIYTIPGAGGSSGSPIFNENWELIGIVARGHGRLEHVMISVGYEYVYNMLKTAKPLLPKLAAEAVTKSFLDTIKKTEELKTPEKPLPGSLLPQ